MDKKTFIYPALALALVSCAQFKAINVKDAGAEQAKLKVQSPGISSYVNIPLMGYKKVDVNLYQDDGKCKSFESMKNDKAHLLGQGTFVGKQNQQDLLIPAGKDIFISATSEEHTGGTVIACTSTIKFNAQADKSYRFDFEPHPTIGWNKTCNGKVYEIMSDGSAIPVSGVVYAQNVGRVYGANLCDG